MNTKQGKPKTIVKTPCLYHFWYRSSPDKLSTKIHNGGHIRFPMNVKMTQNQFVHLEDNVYQISCKSDIIEKSPIMEILRFYNYQTILELRRETLYTYDVIATILNVVNFQFKDEHKTR